MSNCIDPNGFYSMDSFCSVLALPKRTKALMLRALRKDESAEFIEHSRECQYLYGRRGIEVLGTIGPELRGLHRAASSKMNAIRKSRKAVAR